MVRLGLEFVEMVVNKRSSGGNVLDDKKEACQPRLQGLVGWNFEGVFNGKMCVAAREQGTGVREQRRVRGIGCDARCSQPAVLLTGVYQMDIFSSAPGAKIQYSRNSHQAYLLFRKGWKQWIWSLVWCMTLGNKPILLRVDPRLHFRNSQGLIALKRSTNYCSQLHPIIVQ